MLGTRSCFITKQFEQVSTLKNYFSLVKFSHTIFAMPFAMIGFFLGITYVSRNIGFALPSGWQGMPEPGNAHTISILILVVLCMVFARSAAMAFNRWLDKSFDAL